MSLEFTRRSFMKYTALAAVAVAGSGLLAGCSSDNPYQPVGQVGDMLELMGRHTLKSVNLEGQQLTMNMDITCITDRSLRVVPSCFRFEVTDAEGELVYAINGNDSVKLEPNPNAEVPPFVVGGTTGALPKSETCNICIFADTNEIREGDGLKEGDIVSLKFWPSNQSSNTSSSFNIDAFCTWKMVYTNGQLK